MLSRTLDTHAKMKQPKDKQWMHNVLTYLHNFVGQRGSELLVHDDDREEYVNRLVSCLLDAAHSLESGSSVLLPTSCGLIYRSAETVLPEHQILSLEIAPDAELAGTQDGVYVNLNIFNQLPCVCHLKYPHDNSPR